MKNFINKYKSEVIVGIITSLITGIVIKIWDWLVWITPKFGKSIISTINNYTYALAAKQSSSTLIRVMIACLLGGLIAVSAITIKRGILAVWETRKIRLLYKQVKDGDTAALEKHLKEQKDVNSIEQLMNNDSKNSKKILGATIFLLLYTVFIYVLVDTTLMRPSLLASSFESDITMIAPYVEEMDILRLKSDWVCMGDETDYIRIYEFIDDVKEKYELPSK